MVQGRREGRREGRRRGREEGEGGKKEAGGRERRGRKFACPSLLNFHFVNLFSGFFSREI
jgi:hypothetical protein